MVDAESSDGADVARENRLDRRVTVVVTAMTVIAGLIGGLVGAGGAYLGVRAQIRGQNAVVERQIEDSRAAYFRDQRRSAYAQFLQMNTATWIDMQDLLEASYVSHGTGRVQQALGTLDQQMTRFGYALADVRLIGDAKVAERASEVQVAYVRLHVWMARHATAETFRADFVDEAFDRLARIAKLSDRYVSAVRSDIGADAL